MLPALLALLAVAPAPPTMSKIQHLVVIIQENHSFDNYFGTWCQAPSGSSPACTDGAKCCEAGPARDPSGRKPVVLDDGMNAAYDPDHSRGCELAEMNGGRMDRFTHGPKCSNPRNFAYADARTAGTYRDWAARYALADRYFQPVAGASSSNDMFFARAGWVFNDNSVAPDTLGARCGEGPNENLQIFTDRTVGDLLAERGISWRFYSEGYAEVRGGACPATGHPACPAGSASYPCTYDPSDDPFAYYAPFRDNPSFMADLVELDADVRAGALPSVTFIKGLGFRTEHPGSGTKISTGIAFAKSIVDLVLGSPYADDTLILLTYDESGGFFDHVAPPTPSASDGQPYGPRLPMIAIGRFARAGQVSHVVMEHSSVVKFIEWNWLGGKTGQLGTRDAEVANLGSLLDPVACGAWVP